MIFNTTTLVWGFVILALLVWGLYKRWFFPTKNCAHFSITESPFRETAISKKDHQMLHSLMKRTDKLLTDAELEYFVIAGSLMGALRYNNRMPWDDDIDIGIRKELVSRFEALPFDQMGMKIKKVKFGYKIYDKGYHRRAMLESVYPFVDVFIFRENGDRLEYDSSWARKMWPRETMPKQYLYPLGVCQYGDMSLPCPGKAFEFLSQAFPGWDTKAYIAGSHTGQILFRNYTMPINPETTAEVLDYLRGILDP